MTLQIRNWELWQSYRKDRGQPPWIKIHRRLMRDQNWVALSDAQRGQLVAIWMLAADRHGVIPASPEVIRKLCFMDGDPDLNLFIEKEFIERRHDDANLTPERRHDVTPEEKRIEENRRDTASPEIVSRETLSPVPVDGPEGHSSKYAFECGVVRLNQKDFENWKRAFQYLDVPAELTSMADWAMKQEHWFNACSGLLGKRNREQRTKIESDRRSPVKWRSGMEGIV